MKTKDIIPEQITFNGGTHEAIDGTYLIVKEHNQENRGRKLLHVYLVVHDIKVYKVIVIFSSCPREQEISPQVRNWTSHVLNSILEEALSSGDTVFKFKNVVEAITWLGDLLSSHSLELDKR